MKQLILMAGALLMLGIAASAQESPAGVTGKGVKLGLDFSRINTEYDELDDFLDSRVGFTAGAFLTYRVSRQFAVQPEILYVAKGAEKDFFFYTPEWATEYLEIPVLLKFDLMPAGPAHPNLFAGPALDFLLGSEFRVSDYRIDLSDYTQSVDVGLVFGGGIDYGYFTFDARYTVGLIGMVDGFDDFAAAVNEATGAEPGDSYYLDG
ncbi:MAG TPA: porin family protein, partial [candidate division Zixibacteria bacterium]|nr:porin family protein [candidate division Zixibacteria bacterium]